MLAAFRRLPLYWPPGPSAAERNATIDGKGLSPDFVSAFAEWFVHIDLQSKDGVTRDDILELVRELGFNDESKICKRFLSEGEGHLEERRRLSSVGLQESVSLLAQLASSPDEPRKTPAAETGEDGKKEEGASGADDAPAAAEVGPSALPPQERVGPAAVALLRKKVQAPASMMQSASVLQQAMQVGGPRVVQLGDVDGSTPLADPEMPLSPPQGRGMDPVASPFGTVASRSLANDEPEAADDTELQQELERSRLKRLEESLLAQLGRVGSLSSAEEARLRDVRAKLAGPGPPQPS